MWPWTRKRKVKIRENYGYFPMGVERIGVINLYAQNIYVKIRPHWTEAFCPRWVGSTLFPWPNDVYLCPGTRDHWKEVPT